MMGLGIHPMSGIEVVPRAVIIAFLIVTLRRTSPDVSLKRRWTVCVKRTAASLSVVTLLTTSA